MWLDLVAGLFGAVVILAVVVVAVASKHPLRKRKGE
jgi:hypothetical protein